MRLITLILIVSGIFTSPGVVLAQHFPEIMPLDAWEEEIEEEEEITETDREESTTEEEQEEAYREPTPEELDRLEQLATADQLYLAGEKNAAIKLYREIKTPWAIEKSDRVIESKPEPFYNPAQLTPKGKVYWRNYQEGKEKHLESQIFASIKLLTSEYPEFIPGHVSYAKTLKAYEQNSESLLVLERAVNRYPNQSKLLKAKIDADVAAERWLEASIAARQFALFNPQHPEAEEFQQLAEQHLADYRSDLKSKLTWNAVGNAIAGTVGFALTGNLFGPISAVETTSMLLRGETAIGEKIAKNAKKQLPLVEDETVVNYVREIGNKIVKASGRSDFDYEFYVVMDEQFNAFALPGGKVFVNTGAILNTDSEAELAGLLAHEISHAVLSHGFQLVTQGNLTANVVSYIPYVGSTASNLIVLNYSRDMEKQADIFGTRMLVGAGYAADGVRNLMVKLQEFHNRDRENNPTPPAWLSTHPNTKSRVEYMERLVVDNNLNRYGYEGVAHHLDIKDRVKVLWQEYKDCLKKADKEQNYNSTEAKQCAKNQEDTEETKPE